MRLCHRGVLQFIIVKPFMAITDVIMIATNNYNSLPYQTFQFIVYNIRCTCLVSAAAAAVC
jgi:hypothetical protein